MDSKLKKTVYFVRHGQSIDNASPVFQSVDSPLSEIGINQAENIAKRLSAIEFELLIASPIRRAKETAERIANKAGKDVIFSDLFVERIKPSEIDGKPWTDDEANKVWRAWEKSLYSPRLRISDGENYDDTIARVDKALAFLQERPESTLAVVTHGYFLRALVARVLLGDDLTGTMMKRFQERVFVENTAITVLNYRDAFEEDFTWRLWTLNDHSHFAE
ncbi:histidine phosphatase family protein [Candidatus Parcubacteria bacterium]|nr:histidine phosphatase family protein [Candidatus Parcubacteria bacterium]